MAASAFATYYGIRFCTLPQHVANWHITNVINFIRISMQLRHHIPPGKSLKLIAVFGERCNNNLPQKRKNKISTWLCVISWESLKLYHTQVIYKSMNGGLSGEDDKKNA